MSEKCPFKSAKELGLTQEQWSALVKLSGMLERGEIKHIPSGTIYYNKSKDSQKHVLDAETIRFNMCNWSDAILLDGKCGTAACLGGSAEWIAKKRLFGNYPGYPDALENLFHPSHDDWNELTPDIAAKALCHYLKTGHDGDICWNVALGIDV